MTSRIKPEEVSDNVDVVVGDWRSNLVTDGGMRNLYNECQLVILPLKESLQPSGQSVALQAMACGVPVIISKTEGFWDPENFIDEEHLLFVKNTRVEDWTGKISILYEDSKLYDRLSKNGMNLVRSKYNMDAFNKQLESIIDDII